MIKSQSGGLATTKPGQLPEFIILGLGGQAGAGKTHFTGTVGPDNKLLALDLEGGTSTFNSAAFQNDPNKAGDIDVIEFGDVENANKLVHRIESAFDYLIKSKNKEEYDVVSIDSLTEFQERFMSLHQANDPRQSYGAFKDALYSIINKARMVPAHVVFTSRLKAVHDEVLNQEIVRFDMAPKSWSVFSGLCTAIGFLTVKRQGMGNNAKTVRTLDTGFTNRFPGKDRHGIGELTAPSMADVMAVVKGDK